MDDIIKLIPSNDIIKLILSDDIIKLIPSYDMSILWFPNNLNISLKIANNLSRTCKHYNDILKDVIQKHVIEILSKEFFNPYGLNTQSDKDKRVFLYLYTKYIKMSENRDICDEIILKNRFKNMINMCENMIDIYENNTYDDIVDVIFSNLDDIDNIYSDITSLNENIKILCAYALCKMYKSSLSEQIQVYEQYIFNKGEIDCNIKQIYKYLTKCKQFNTDFKNNLYQNYISNFYKYSRDLDEYNIFMFDEYIKTNMKNHGLLFNNLLFDNIVYITDNHLNFCIDNINDIFINIVINILICIDGLYLTARFGSVTKNEAYYHNIMWLFDINNYLYNLSLDYITYLNPGKIHVENRLIISEYVYLELGEIFIINVKTEDVILYIKSTLDNIKIYDKNMSLLNSVDRS